MSKRNITIGRNARFDADADPRSLMRIKAVVFPHRPSKHAAQKKAAPQVEVPRHIANRGR
jgi:hypothetical protein